MAIAQSDFCFFAFAMNAANKFADAAVTDGFDRFFDCFGWTGGLGLITAETAGTWAGVLFSTDVFFVMTGSSGTGGGDFYCE